MRRTNVILLVAVLGLSATLAEARVLSYAPYSSRSSFSAIQKRTTRHFVLMESTAGALPLTMVGNGYVSPIAGELVLYDSKGLSEPRVLLPILKNTTSSSLGAVALWEDEQEVPRILVETDATLPGEAHTNFGLRWLFSSDGGQTWRITSLPLIATPATFDGVQQPFAAPPFADIGGPVLRGAYSPIRIGMRETPFLVTVVTNVMPMSKSSQLWTVDANGVASNVALMSSTAGMIGTDATGRYALLRTTDTVATVFDTKTLTNVQQFLIDQYGTWDGWIAPDGGVFLVQTNGYSRLWYFRNGSGSQVAGPYDDVASSQGSMFFAVPTFDFSGAWIVQRANNRPTTLLLFTPANGLVKEWSDPAGPQIEAIHTAASGKRLLLQVHRTRPQADQRVFKDPALAVWELGKPAPAGYDELFMNEVPTKGFVHVDVDSLAAGDPFIFDSGATVIPPNCCGGIIISPAPPPPSGGGGDVTQEWGVVRASLQQRLVIPGVARTAGNFGSFWQSDLTFYNPDDQPVVLQLRYVPTGDGIRAEDIMQTTLTVGSRQIRVIPDALKSLFDLDNGGGALFITPFLGQAISASCRTYSTSATGTVGMNMNAIELTNAASPRFPATFAGAFPGSGFRTNLVITDTSGRGTVATAQAVGPFNASALAEVPFGTPANGQMQFNSIAPTLGLRSSDTAALVFHPASGEAIASVITIDNKTNDPTYYPPDLPSPVVRTIPAIGHLDGANGSKFRSDLYLFNASDAPRTVTLQMTMWDYPVNSSTYTIGLAGHESKVIRDVLFTLFNRTGVARLRYVSSNDPTGVRATSRTYTIDADGGTTGFLMPPLNNFQSAGPGDVLEIIAAGGKNFRTNLGLVELTATLVGVTVNPTFPVATARIEIYDDTLTLIDHFDTSVMLTAGVQLNDIFHTRGLGDGPRAALIRVIPASGMIGAYAAVLDNGTNDASYVGANLAAKE
ncbi:MAG TPA: hypothetical protein VEZ11_11975 [Thermoanaerobaculia bacterium]|nr:hypothetical protein [Thermoanaerobaculia bacterium]